MTHLLSAALLAGAQFLAIRTAIRCRERWRSPASFEHQIPGHAAVGRLPSERFSPGSLGGTGRSKSFAMDCINVPRPSGLERTTSTPAAETSEAAARSLNRVNRMIFTFGIACFSTEAASIPLRFGIAKSKRIKSGSRIFAFAMASRPSTASPHTLRPWVSRKVETRVRMVALSSAMRMRFGADARRRAVLGTAQCNGCDTMSGIQINM